MRSNQTSIPVNLLQGHVPPPEAATYFGQFVDHDLTFDLTPLQEAGFCEPADTINHRTPWLDLDHIYGDGPGSERHHHIYESDDASFRIGHSSFGGEPFDIPLTEDGLPLLVDDRNGENVMIRQVQAMFLKLHNAAVREVPANLPPRDRFEHARERVRWQYQWLVRNWYLRKICEPEVYKAVIERGDRRIDWRESGFAIPVEFSLAAMRFGHSMVRPEYRLNKVARVEGGSGLISLADLFGAKNNVPLDSRLKIDWALLSRDGAMSIDTALVEPLFHLPHEH
ncbi:MAG TPA: peroxidase family protein, partial [Chthoniobacterales bacterium]|nr:peroxidase family protein [Chthoniobacterales bacterium]